MHSAVCQDLHAEFARGRIKEDETMKVLLVVALGCVFAVAAAPGLAQERSKTAGEAEAGTFAWGHGLAYVRNHFVKAAEEFPEDKYGYRPNEDTRTFGEIVMHVARYNHLNAADDLGKPPQDVSEFAFHSKAQAVAKLKESFQELEEALKHKPGSGNVADSMIHASEHYGNLATYYRLNGLVPPASR
jgi:DinB superfamily